MSGTRLRPATTRVAMAAWGLQAVIAVGWLASSVVDGASLWVWPFGVTWAVGALVLLYRARRQAVVVDDEGMTLLSGLSRTATIPWGAVRDISPDPPGPLTTHLAVVLTDTRIVETPLGKGDARLREAWLERRQGARGQAEASPGDPPR
jgi:Bacterial PH domain